MSMSDKSNDAVIGRTLTGPIDPNALKKVVVSTMSPEGEIVAADILMRDLIMVGTMEDAVKIGDDPPQSGATAALFVSGLKADGSIDHERMDTLIVSTMHTIFRGISNRTTVRNGDSVTTRENMPVLPPQLILYTFMYMAHCLERALVFELDAVFRRCTSIAPSAGFFTNLIIHSVRDDFLNALAEEQVKSESLGKISFVSYDAVDKLVRTMCDAHIEDCKNGQNEL